MKQEHPEAVRRSIAAIIVVMLAASLSANAQTLVATVTVGDYPVAIAVNPSTNKIYVVNQNGNNMTVIDGASYNTNIVPTGLAPNALVVNPTTNKIYVSNSESNTVTAVDGLTHSTATISVGSYPIAIAANSVTNKIYVANYYSNNVTVINGATNRTTTVSVGRNPYAVAVNAATNKIYVADCGSNDVVVIDGATNTTTTVAVGAYPRAVAIDENTNRIFVVNYNSNTVSVIDGATETVISNVSVGSYPAAVTVNPARAQVFVANNGSSTATIIDEITYSTTTVSAGTAPNAVDVNPITNKAYFTDPAWDGVVTMVDGNGGSPGSVLAGIYPTAIVTNWETNTIYVADTVGNSVSVILGASSDPLQFVPVTPCRIADTRGSQGPFGGPFLPGGTSRSFVVPQSSCNIPATAIAYSLNVTVAPVQATLNYLTLWPTGETQPYISTLNSYDGRVKANAAIVPAGAGGAVSVYVTDPANVILDINGYFQLAGSDSLEFYPLAPCRVVDTRNAPGELGGPALVGGQERDFPVMTSNCQIPSDGLAYSMNFTVSPVHNKPLGYLTVWPSGQNQPIVSTLNNPTATIVANAAIVAAGTNGAIAIYPDQETNLIVDINGYFAAPAPDGLSLYSTLPCRVIDTRSSGGAFSGQRNPSVNVAASQCITANTAQEYVLNATAMPVGSLGYLTLWADGAGMPSVSTLNAADGMVTSNMAIVGNQDGSVDAYAYGVTNLILDISSYFAP